MPVRPIKFRYGVRVLLLAGTEVLLINDSDPGVPTSSWWVVPGGGIDDGEPALEAACREVAEETGFELTSSQLVGPVGGGVAVHGYSDRIRVQQDVFYRAVVPRFVPDLSGWTPWERQRMKGAAWHRLDHLPDALWPNRLPELVAAIPGCPTDLGTREESTVPLTDAEWQRVRGDG
ncbi:MAG: NUDIX domain-containing protein [Arachnia propionica]|uniref:NUDIX hydrolase n=1 Tax=Arachnia propionica TaxID=1750 RepID=UPI00270597F4|nr:NUDIX domain-containing protein [Arachnia propionica]